MVAFCYPRDLPPLILWIIIGYKIVPKLDGESGWGRGDAINFYDSIGKHEIIWRKASRISGQAIAAAASSAASASIIPSFATTTTANFAEETWET